MKSDSLDLCKRLVQDLGVKIFIMDFMGVERIYSVEEFALPDSHGNYCEVVNGKDITKVVENGQFNFYTGRVSQDRFNELTQSIVKETFKFSPNNYILFTSVKENL